MLGIAQTYPDQQGRAGCHRATCRRPCTTTCSACQLNFLARTRTGEMQSRVSHDINGVEPVIIQHVRRLRCQRRQPSIAVVAAMAVPVVAVHRW